MRPPCFPFDPVLTLSLPPLSWVRSALRHYDQDACDRSVQGGLLHVAVPRGQEADRPGDQPGDQDQEGGQREVRLAGERSMELQDKYMETIVKRQWPKD